MSGDAQNAFLFQCGNEQLFAVSLDKTGLNIPRSTCTQGWLLREEFLLGVQEPVPAAISPEPILRGIWAKGLLRMARRQCQSGQGNLPVKARHVTLPPPADLF
jgi:hypothetical protein